MKELNFQKYKKKLENVYELTYKFNMGLPGNQKVWIPQKILLYRGPSNIVLISKGEGNIRYLLEKYLQQKITLSPFSIKEKKLLILFRSLKKHFIREDHIIYLQRIILHNTYFESSLIKELNFKANDAEQVDLFNELVRNAKKIKVITFQIKWNLFNDNGRKVKPMTVRISNNGSILIYGNHPDNRIQLLIDTLDAVIKE